MSYTLTKKIENLFEQTNIETASIPVQIILDKLQLKYEPMDNDLLMENISYMATAMNSTYENWNLFFTRLIPFFEIGFLFCENNLKNQFLFGKEINCKNKSFKLKMPNSDFFHILKTDSNSFLTKFGLSNILYTDKMNCFYVRVDENISMVLITTKAEPWLQLKMDSLQKALINHQL
jgi:hypothetical protein